MECKRIIDGVARELGVGGLLTDILQIEPTRNCNLKCKSCTRTPDLHGNISIETFKQILEHHDPRYFDWIKLQGLGEPFMHPEIAQLVDIAKSIGFKQVMTITNGTFPIIGDFDRVVFSINTLDRSRNPNIEKVLNNLDSAMERIYNVSINCVLSCDSNKNDVKEISKFAEQHGIHLDFTPAQVWYGCKHESYEEARECALNAYELFNIHYTHRILDCEWGITSLYYDYLGRLHPCCIRMNDEYIIDDEETFDYEECCKECPL
jgi:MoaA/NifB/PqqE/SkfB family radical SAM enzyme